MFAISQIQTTQISVRRQRAKRSFHFNEFKSKLETIFCFFASRIVKPSIMPFSFGDESFNTGDSTGVSCMIVKGDLPLQITWTLNNEPIISGDNGITINKLSAKSSVLNIASVEKEHRGIIKCIAENMAGIDTFASELSVNGTTQRQPKSKTMSFSVFVLSSSSVVLFIPKSFDP